LTGLTAISERSNSWGVRPARLTRHGIIGQTEVRSTPLVPAAAILRILVAPRRMGCLGLAGRPLNTPSERENDEEHRKRSMPVHRFLPPIGPEQLSATSNRLDQARVIVPNVTHARAHRPARAVSEFGCNSRVTTRNRSPK